MLDEGVVLSSDWLMMQDMPLITAHLFITTKTSPNKPFNYHIILIVHPKIDLKSSMLKIA